MLVANGDLGADAQAAPGDAADVDAEEEIGPAFDVKTGVGESEEPGEGAHAGEDDHHEGVYSPDAAASLDSRGFEEQGAE